MEQSLSSIRYIDRLRAPITVAYGSFKSRNFSVEAAFCPRGQSDRKPVKLIEAPSFNHFEMCESIGNPYGPTGLQRSELMKLA